MKQQRVFLSCDIRAVQLRRDSQRVAIGCDESLKSLVLSALDFV
jgi:hypothetical protein